MKRITLALSAAGLLLTIAACNNQQTASEAAKSDSLNKTASKPEAPLPDSVMMKNWMAYMTPGDVHKMIASWDGTWEGQVTMWMKPGAEPSKSTSITVNKMALDGRYQISTHKGTMMEGMPFEGIGTLAYDNAKKVFIQTWIDNMGTGIMKVEGPWDAATKSITLTGNVVDAGLGTGKEVQMKEVVKIIDDNNHIFEMYAPGPDGKEFKTMEIIYSRKM
jgi:hypothetical protein